MNIILPSSVVDMFLETSETICIILGVYLISLVLYLEFLLPGSYVQILKILITYKGEK